MNARVHIFEVTVLGRGRVASPMLGHLSPWESPGNSFYRRLSGSQDQSEQGEVKKNLHPSDTQDRTRAILSIAKCLATWATWPTLAMILICKLLFNPLVINPLAFLLPSPSELKFFLHAEHHRSSSDLYSSLFEYCTEDIMTNSEFLICMDGLLDSHKSEGCSYCLLLSLWNCIWVGD